MPSVIAPVEMELMDGRSVKLRLSFGTLIRFERSSGYDFDKIGALSGSKRLEAMGWLFWEVLIDRKEFQSMEEFCDLIPLGGVENTFIELMRRFGPGGGNGKRPLAEASESPGPSDGPSVVTISDSAAASSGT